MALKHTFIIKEAINQGGLKRKIHPELTKAIEELVSQTYESNMIADDDYGTDDREFIEAVEKIAILAGVQIYWNDRDVLDKQHTDDVETAMSAPPGYKPPGDPSHGWF